MLSLNNDIFTSFSFLYNSDIHTAKVQLLSQKQINMIGSFLKTTNKTDTDVLTNTCISWYDFRYLQEQQGRLAPSITLNQISSKIWQNTEQFSLYLRGVFTWYLTISYCIFPYAVTFGTFCSMAPWMCSLHCQWCRENRIRSDIFRSLYITAGYIIIWAEVEALQRRIFSSTQQIVFCYDLHSYMFRLLIHLFRQLKLFLILWKLITSTLSSEAHLRFYNSFFCWWILPRDIRKN